MVGSIDPRCETVRGTHWPEDRSCGCLELASRKPSWPAVQSDRTNRPDIWMQAIRSDRKNSCGTGAVHIWVRRSPGRQFIFAELCTDDHAFIAAQIQRALNFFALSIEERRK